MEIYPKGVKWKLKIYTAPQKEFFQKYFVVHERWAVKNSSSTYVWSKVDSCFCEVLYHLNWQNLLKSFTYYENGDENGFNTYLF